MFRFLQPGEKGSPEGEREAERGDRNHLSFARHLHTHHHTHLGMSYNLMSGQYDIYQGITDDAARLKLWRLNSHASHVSVTCSSQLTKMGIRGILPLKYFSFVARFELQVARLESAGVRALLYWYVSSIFHSEASQKILVSCYSHYNSEDFSSFSFISLLSIFEIVLSVRLWHSELHAAM